MAKVYTTEEMEILRANPNVKEVKENRVRLTFEFRKILFAQWKDEPGQKIVRKVLAEHGFDVSMFNKGFVENLHKRMRKFGEPTNGKSAANARELPGEDDAQYLINSGKFKMRGSQVCLTASFVEELRAHFPEQSVEEGIVAAGLDPKRVGYSRMYQLERRFRLTMNQSVDSSQTAGGATSSVRYTEEKIQVLMQHPYVKTVYPTRLVFHKALYKEAARLVEDLSVTEVLNIFEIPEGCLNSTSKTNFLYRCRNVAKEMSVHDASGSDADEVESNNGDTEEGIQALILEGTVEQKEQYVRIQYKRMYAMESIVSAQFDAIREQVQTVQPLQRRIVCEWIRDDLPKEQYGTYSVRGILNQVGISKSSYYSVLRDDGYVQRAKAREARLQKDMETVRTVVEYKGYPKGSRQVYMQMESLTGKHMSRKKIMRLMQRMHLQSTVRKANPARRASRKYLQKHVKPNRLKRKFRLARPGKIFLTDVTYLKYGPNSHLLAYGSASIDSVTGRLYTFQISEFNDIDLALDTLRALPEQEARDKLKPLLHSDQGVLYLTDEFQELAEALGFQLSMSKRGNCWDNSPQERFFSTLKTECPYKEAKDLNELRNVIQKYSQYYNEERRQWTRNRLTPMAYEAYLNEMNDEDFRQWQACEEERYEKMKKKAKEKAIERAKTLGV